MRDRRDRQKKKFIETLEAQSTVLHAAKAAGISRWTAANENPKVVSERLGHASITLTMDTYSHVLPDMQQGASDKLEQMLFTKTGTQ
jgi:integrase